MRKSHHNWLVLLDGKKWPITRLNIILSFQFTLYKTQIIRKWKNLELIKINLKMDSAVVRIDISVSQI